MNCLPKLTYGKHTYGSVQEQGDFAGIYCSVADERTAHVVPTKIQYFVLMTLLAFLS